MCNIVTFRFICEHTLRRQRSRCGGTKHRITSSSIKAACIAESYLTIHLKIGCGACQHKAWEESWELKLEIANTFLAKLRQRNMPGAAETCALVRELETQYATATWDTRNMFASVPKPSVKRVKHNYYEKAASKLTQEVLPEDVIEKKHKEWAKMDEEDYDGNYVASTDPIHPVSTDYSHTLDDDDGAWILQHLSPQEIEPSLSDGFDLHNHGWSWGESDNGLHTEEVTQPEHIAEDFSEDKGTISTRSNTSMDLVAWGPEITKTSTSKITMNGQHDNEAQHSARVKQVLNAFWSAVNAAPLDPRDTPTPHSTNLDNLLEDLDLSKGHSAQSTSTIIPRQHPCTDFPPRPPLRPSTYSTRSCYDEQREILRRRKDADVNKYHADWLHVSRCEMRDAEGPEGRKIWEPLKVKRGLNVVKIT
jgi:hypothetical protein